MKKLRTSLFIITTLLLVALPYAMACEGECDPANCPHKVDCPHKAEGMDHSHKHKCMSETQEKAMDPICGMMIDKAHAADQAEYKGETYYFCMKEEKETFLENPEKYLEEIKSKRSKCKNKHQESKLIPGENP